MAGHDMSINVRVSLLTAQVLDYWSVCQAKLAKRKERKLAVFVPSVQGDVISLTGSQTKKPTPKRKASLPWQEKAAATCLTQTLNVLSQSHESPQWSPDETPDWAWAGEDSPRCSFDSHVSFEIEMPADYIHLSDLMAAREVAGNDSASDSGSSASRLS
ncbi:hypothetical protein AC578_5331 [Pseudocercospora eumusae]|uniref:Uncharacterized protein n=1 Tax=Pseudocercospora eumusae TaxID=321146 RepID=A0A139GUI3_9PEZI|nr:hypothetical protein AC578_5331 [Pseudocercospora eumusae]